MAFPLQHHDTQENQQPAAPLDKGDRFAQEQDGHNYRQQRFYGADDRGIGRPDMSHAGKKSEDRDDSREESDTANSQPACQRQSRDKLA